ncbi:MAG: glycosyltransferase family 39 protein, partial [Chloroflexota bacterium]
MNNLRSSFKLEPALFALTLLVGVALRFYALGDLPHGIYHDEAYYGLDAVSVLEGARPIFFPANNGREPLYIYILSLSVAAFGRTPFDLRFASAVIGTLTMPVTYLLGRALFNRRVGLLAMAICAVTFWPVALSRVSFRAGALPLFLGLAIALGWLGLARRNLLLAILGGAAYGLAFNTYTAARVTPLALGVMAVLVLWRRANCQFALQWREMFAFILAAIVVVAPLGFYALAHPEQVFAREGQVSIFETE